MKLIGHQLRLAATDLSNHLSCRRLTSLDWAHAVGIMEPPAQNFRHLESLRERGLAHEKAYLDHLRNLGLRVELVSNKSAEAAVEHTRDLMRLGVDVIAQGALLRDRWFGRPDVLLRIDRHSESGSFTYEVADTKLTQNTQAGTILQLCLYSDLLSSIQGQMPAFVSVVIPNRNFMPERYRLAEYEAYYRTVKHRFEEVIDRELDLAATYPLPTGHCDVCRWWPNCEQRWRIDDHPSVVAGLSVLHAKQFADWGATTVVQIADLAVPLSRPTRGSSATYDNLREQARLQLVSRGREVPAHELRPLKPNKGLARLPEPSSGDIFLDFEAARFVDPGGMEYLLGWSRLDVNGALEYHAHWALNREEERRSFEDFLDTLTGQREQHPTFHVFHFGAYDLAALKRLATRYSTREEELDVLLREERFVDLHAALRQSVRIGVDSYTLKSIEACYRFNRRTGLRAASRALRNIEYSLDFGLPDTIDFIDRTTVQEYNREDCESAFFARAWLERLRTDLVSSGVEVERPPIPDGKPTEVLGERIQYTQAIAAALQADIPSDPAKRSPEQHARVLLAQNLGWHRREAKVSWWELFRLAALDDEGRIEDPAAIAGLKFIQKVPGGTTQCPIHRYSLPLQEVDLRGKPTAYASVDCKIGTVVKLDHEKLFVDIKKKQKYASIHPTSVFLHSYIGTKEQADALLRLGDWVNQNGIDSDARDHRAARDLLLRRVPRGIVADQLAGYDEENQLTNALGVATALDHGVLPVQGPPGAGKTYTGARMIVDLVRKKRRVGITATSHKVIRNLLEEVVRAAKEAGLTVACLQKADADDEDFASTKSISVVETNAEVLKVLDQGQAQVIGGTAWMWARADFAGSVEVLVIDEAGQVSLANALAVAQAAQSLILLGDPQQLEQPTKADHPAGSDLSALEHLLGDYRTLPRDRGLFLAHTWRMHPKITAFTSEQFYENRLESVTQLGKQTIEAPGLGGPGLFRLLVGHSGNQNQSVEEVAAIEAWIRDWLDAGATWTNLKGEILPLTLADILVVTPYNVQVAALAKKLPAGSRIGTVDKFQGQEAPVVFYSMTSSSAEDAPRGMEFLYSRNRLNVATSRARCACVLVCSPQLLQPDCRTPRQIQLANSLCRYTEMATALE